MAPRPSDVSVAQSLYMDGNLETQNICGQLASQDVVQVSLSLMFGRGRRGSIGHEVDVQEPISHLA